MSLKEITTKKLLKILPESLCQDLADRYIGSLYLPKIESIANVFISIMDRDDSWPIFEEFCETFPECIHLTLYNGSLPLFLGKSIYYEKEGKCLECSVPEDLSLKRNDQIIAFFMERGIHLREGIKLERIGS